MATIGRGVYAQAAHEFFDALRAYDAAGAAAALADDAELASPWGSAEGKEAIEALLADWVKPSLDRPSYTIADIQGDGNVTTLKVSVSGRFGSKASMHSWRLLVLKGKVHHIVIS